MTRKEIVCLLIPTIGRLSSLLNTIKTFQASSYKKTAVIVIVDDGRQEYFRQIKNMIAAHKLKNVFLYFNSKRLGWPRSMNKLLKASDFDLYFYGSDDLTFGKQTIKNAVSFMADYFPDGDGVIGIAQNLHHYCPAAFGLVGRKFIERFPDRQLFWPHYVHFCGDSELWHFAKSIDKFKFCATAKVHHDRPMDAGKRLAQKSLRKDRELWWKKKGKKNLYWGNTFLTPADLANEKPCRRWNSRSI